MTNPSLAYRRPRSLLAHLGSSSIVNERTLLVCLVIIALIAHGLNMFHYPAFTTVDDEGIYASQAWSVLREHRLAPYTYFYDHAPGGWVLLAVWMAVTGGIHAFGTAIDSGRVLMLLLHLAMVPLLYQIARKLGCSVAAAAFAGLLFSLSPLALFFQRMILLDTIMLFWLLLGLNLLLDGWGRLSRVVLAGMCFGLAIVSKETALFLLPAILFIGIQQRWQHQGHFALGGWLVPMVMVVSWYLLYAALKGELIPGGEAAGFVNSGDMITGGASSRVSLVSALIWQTSRSGGGPFNLHNEFWQLVHSDWMPRDPILFAGGAVATLLNLLRGIRNRRVLAAGLLGFVPLVYLARGGVVSSLYILFAIPFLCLNLAVLITPLLARLPARAAGAAAALMLVVLVAGYWRAGTLQPLYTSQADGVGRDALVWAKQHLAAQSLIVTPDAFWTDLHEPGFSGPAFPNVHSHWKVALDPAIRDGVFHQDWHTVDYLIMTPNLKQDFQASGDSVALDALSHSHLVKRWQTGSDSSVEIWKVDKPDATGSALLASSSTYVSNRFSQAGAYAAPDGSVSSESEAYAMLRQVWSGDRTGFLQTWNWTRTHLQRPDGLLTWMWQDNAVVDAHSASDADTDTALALLMAGRRWNDPRLVNAGQAMVNAIWNHEVVTAGSASYLTAGDWATSGPVLTLNPSYFAPYAYHIFAEVDHSHNWLSLIDSSYDVLFSSLQAPLDLKGTPAAGLPPDWLGLDPATGALSVVQLPRGKTARYGYDAARTYWRIALDLRWTNDGRAEKFLGLAGFLQEEVQRQGAPSAVYSRDGAPVESAPSLVGDAGALAALLTLDPAMASRVYAAQIVGGSNRDDWGISWGNPNDLYTQEWGWFALALYNNALPDLWHKG